MLKSSQYFQLNVSFLSWLTADKNWLCYSGLGLEVVSKTDIGFYGKITSYGLCIPTERCTAYIGYSYIFAAYKLVRDWSLITGSRGGGLQNGRGGGACGVLPLQKGGI